MTPRRFLVLGAATLVAACGGIAYASIPDSGGIIHACFKDNGDLRVIDSAAGKKDDRTCKNNETALDWNQQGPIGAPGPAGPAGAKGDTGAQGLHGADAIQFFVRLAADGSILAASSTVLHDAFTGKFTFPGSVGQYQVHFDQTVSDCVPVASAHARTLNDADAAFATVSFTSTTQVGVTVYEPNGAPVDQGFDLLMEC